MNKATFKTMMAVQVHGSLFKRVFNVDVKYINMLVNLVSIGFQWIQLNLASRAPESIVLIIYCNNFITFDWPKLRHFDF